MKIKSPIGVEYEFSPRQITEAGRMIPDQLTDPNEIVEIAFDIWPSMPDEEIMAMALAISIDRMED